MVRNNNFNEIASLTDLSQGYTMNDYPQSRLIPQLNPPELTSALMKSKGRMVKPISNAVWLPMNT